MGVFLCLKQSDCKIVSAKAKLNVLKAKYCYNTFGHSICGCLFLFMCYLHKRVINKDVIINWVVLSVI